VTGSNPPAGLNFEPSNETKLLIDQVDDFIEKEVKPIEKEYDHLFGDYSEKVRTTDEGRLVDEVLEARNKVRQLSVEPGFYSMHMPEEVGGGGLSTLEFCLVLEEIFNRHPEGFHDFVVDTISLSPSVTPLYYEEQMREKYFEPLMNATKTMAVGLTEPQHGSDITCMDTTAEKDGDEWVIDGTKCFISGSPYADFIMVHARTSGKDGDARGISSFIVDRDNPGWEVGKLQRPMGTDVGMHAFNHFNECRVPEHRMVGDEGRGFIDTAMQWVGGGRLTIPAKVVGRTTWMFEQSLDYVQDRESFGEPISNRQFVQGMLAEMRTDIEQLKWQYRSAAWRYDRDEGERWEQSAAKLRAAETWNDIADKAVQIHGGSGYMRSLPFEGEFRDARAARIYHGTDEIQRRAIARDLLNQ
jgi:alkylation response protein AidB-like acyl-CoA dehydrogenase